MSSAKNKLTAAELALFGVLGGLMYASRVLMQALPNIHLLALFIAVETRLFRHKALWPIYTYVLLEGLFGGFSAWWIPYLYVWALLWAVLMLLPKNMPPKLAPFVYALVCGLHGLAFGILYAPAQMLLYGLSGKAIKAWIVAGFPYDCIHGASNFVLVLLLIVPLSKALSAVQKGLCKTED